MRLPFNLQGSTSNRLLSIVVVIVFLLICSSALYFPRYLNFNPDEARIVIELEGLAAGWFDENPLRTGTHLGSQLQYYLLPKITTVTVKTLRVLAAVFFILTLVYVIWLSRAYALFSKPALLVLLLLVGTNGGLNFYGLWGVFDYSQRILQSVFLLHMLLFLHKRQLNLSKRALALVLFGLCLVTLGYPALLLPIVVLLVVSFLCRGTTENRDTRYPAKAALKSGMLLLIPVIAVGLISLKYASHPEFLNPRTEIQHLFFPLSDHPKTAAGLLAFLFSATVSFIANTFFNFAPIAGSSMWPPSLSGASGMLTLIVALGFIIGLIRSLFERTRDPTRFVIGAYVFSVLVCLAGLAVAGLYAFGDIRYALFLYIPLLMVAAFGIIDVGRWITRRLLPSSFVDRARGVGSPILVGVALLMSVGAADLARSERSRFNVEFTRIMELIETDRSPLLFYDTFAEWHLKVLGRDEFPNRRKFLFDFFGPRPYEEFLSFVASREDVLWITYHTPPAEPFFAPYVAELEKTHVKNSELSTDFWRVATWRQDSPLPYSVDIGHVTARRWMRTGWERDEGSDGETFAWSNGDRSVLTVPLPAGGDIRMDFDALPFVFPRSPPQRVTIVLNGTVLEEVQLQPGLQRYSVNLPAAALRESSDTLEFRYAYARVPREVLPNSSDVRELAVAWFSINFAPPASPR
jgi:hypothetical protein